MFDVLVRCTAVKLGGAVPFGTSRPGSGRLGQDENAVVMVFLDASGMITYLRVKETKTFIDQFFKVYYFLMITYLRVKETKTTVIQ